MLTVLFGDVRARALGCRYIADFRLVVATMHADIVPVSYVRGRCTVTHREHVEDMAAYKRIPDAFYWSQVRLASRPHSCTL